MGRRHGRESCAQIYKATLSTRTTPIDRPGWHSAAAWTLSGETRCGHLRPSLAVWERSSMLRTLASLALLLVCASTFATTGVALVHGTGKQTDAYNDYWQAGMVNSIRQGLPDQSNYVVIN